MAVSILLITSNPVRWCFFMSRVALKRWLLSDDMKFAAYDGRRAAGDVSRVTSGGLTDTQPAKTSARRLIDHKLFISNGLVEFLCSETDFRAVSAGFVHVKPVNRIILPVKINDDFSK